MLLCFQLAKVGISNEINCILRTHLFSLSSNNYLEAGTTRPETVFADCALVVNPFDERFSKYIGCRVRHPLLPCRTLPVLADVTVKADKGTGKFRKSSYK